MNDQQRDIIRTSIGEIIDLERQDVPNWNLINDKVERALKFLVENELDGAVDSYVIKYLDDVAIRESDKNYGDYQRKVVGNLI